MGTDRDYQLHNLVHMSLREHLVPARTWLNYVSNMESVGPLRVNVPEDDGNSHGWLVAYPYRVPYFVAMLRRKFPERTSISMDEVLHFTPEEVEEWHSAVRGRLQTFTESAIDECSLAELDEAYDYGVLIHRSTGWIRPFDYTMITGISLFACANTAERALYGQFRAKNHGIDSLTDSIVDARMKALGESQDKYSLYVSFDYPKGSDGDAFNQQDNYSSATMKAWLSAEEISHVRNIVHDMFTAHAKVIIVP